MESVMSFEKILALDTATETVSVALSVGDAQFYRSDDQYNKHSEQILPFVDSVLSEAHMTLADIDAIAFGAGPGAFTGLRVACGVAQGLGWAAGKPLVAVSNLEAAVIKGKADGRVLVALDARMKECYTAVYEVKDTALVATCAEPLVARPEELGALCEKHGVTAALGDAFERYAERITLAPSVQVLPVGCATAAEIALLGRTAARAGKTVPAQLAAPLYVRNRVALTIDERSRGQTL